jgi:peptidoglycan/LPS O-acetylase OafA/YrhL
MISMPYTKSIDGLRGVSILLVLIVHATNITPTLLRDTPESYVYATLRYAWIGVDCFFVLSGFLITTILLADRGGASAGRYFGSFYARRALRIFPIYYLFLGVLFVATASQGYAGKEWLALATYTHNFYRLFTHSEFTGYVAHVWSLAVEEHFYLLWPAAVYFLSAKRAAQLICMLVLAILCLRAGLVLSGNEYGMYINTFARADSLLIGALLAYVRSTGHPFSYEAFVPYRRALLWGGTAALVGAQVAFAMYSDNFFNLTLGFTILALVCGCVLSNALDIGTATKAFLERQWLCSLGKISYGVYLFHFPIFTLLGKNVFSRFDSWKEGWFCIDLAVFLACGLAITLPLAALSFRCVERPLLARKPKRSIARATTAKERNPMPEATRSPVS